MSKLTQDIVWFVEQERVVPVEGNMLSEQPPTHNRGINWRRRSATQAKTQTIKVLVPQVYTVSRPTDVVSKNAVISADSIVGSLSGNINNSGAISALNLNQLHADSLTNRGVINATAVALKTTGDFINLGGQIEAAKQLLVQAGGRLEGISTEKDRQEGNTHRHLIDKQAVFRVTDADGLLSLSSEKEMLFKGAKVSSAGDIFAHSKDKLTIDSLRVSENSYTGGGDNFHRTRKEQDVGSEFRAANNLSLIGEKSLYTKAAQISSDFGRVHLQSKGDVTLDAGLMIDEEERKSKSKKRRRLGTSKKTTENYHYRYDESAQATLLNGENVSVVGHNVTLNGTQVLANTDIHVQAQGKISVNGVVENHQQTQWQSVKKSGLSGSLKNGVATLSLGKSKQGGSVAGKTETVGISYLNAAKGNVMMTAKDRLSIDGSAVGAGKDIYLEGSDIKLGAIYTHGETEQRSYAKSSVIRIGLTYDPIRAAWKAGKDHYQGNAGGGKSIIGKATTLADAMDEFGQRLLKTATFAIGGQSRSSERHTTTDNATVSQLTAGGNLIMKATQGGII